MVFNVDDSIVAVGAPSLAPQADLRVSPTVLASSRYLAYADHSLLVVLVETRPVSTAAASKFALWQVWNAHDFIRCVRFNPSKKKARGALALCTDKGRAVLLMPASVTSSRATAGAETLRASALKKTGKRLPSVANDSDFGPRPDYVKAHLHLYLPRWAESVRWQCDDHLLNHLEWVESGDDLLLAGAGEKLSLWKLVDDSVQVHLQRTIVLSGGEEAPVAPVWHFDVAPSGRFAATAGKNDRIIKVWNLGKVLPHDGAATPLFLAHTRALVCITWSKDVHVYDVGSTVATTTSACEMLFTLDRAGNISIWRESRSSLWLFVLWKQFAAADFCSSPFNEDNERLETRIRVFGLVNHYWARGAPKPVLSMNEALLSESTTMDALCLFHYGCGSLKELHQNELVGQRMDSISQMNTNLLGHRSGAVADTHIGEAFICGNVALEQTFVVHLIYGVLSNGDFCVFRGTSTPFTGVSPRLSLLLSYTGLQEKLINAHIYSVCSSDYQEQGNGSTVFYMELLFQQKTDDSYLHCARLKLQVDNGSVGICGGSGLYTVRNCEVSVVCNSMMSAVKERNVQVASFLVANMIPRFQSDLHADSSRFAGKAAILNMDGRLIVFQANGSLGKLEIVSRSKTESSAGPIRHTASYEKRSVLYFVTGGKLYAAIVASGDTLYVEKDIENSSMEPSGARRDSTLLIEERDTQTLSVCYMDESEDFEMLDRLISVVIPESVKIAWSNSSMFFAQSAINNATKDYSMVVGMHKGGEKLTVWVFSFEITVSESFASSVQLFRKTTVELPEARLLDIATVPLVNTFEITLASFDADLMLTLWTFADLDDLLGVKPAHRVDIGELMRTADRAQKSHQQFHTPEQHVVYKHFSFSSCGRVSLLFGGDDNENDGQICLLSTTASLLEGVVTISHKQLGQVVSLKWTPPAASNQDCELILLSTTAIAMLKSDCSRATNKWSIAWSFSRFSMRPEKFHLLSSYPYGLLRVGFSLVHLNIRDIDRVGSSPLQVLPENCPRVQALVSQSPSNVFPAHHPVILMYLLARGSIETLEKVLEHVKTQIQEHEETCYLQMADNTLLQTLPLLSLSQLLGNRTSTEDNRDERPAIYLRGKESKKTEGISHYAALARASDLFAMDFEVPRRYGASGASSDRADMLFAPPSSFAYDATESKPTASLKSKLETDIFPKYFNEHKGSLTFMTTQELDIFLRIVTGIKKTVSWERDSSRQKDEAALRFHASLLWSAEQPARPASVLPTMANSDAPEQQTVSVATARTSSSLGAEGLCSEQVAWGALSDYQPELLQECFPATTMSWKEMKRVRLPFWLRSSTKLIQFVEKVAQVEYAAKRDPFAVAIFYVLLGKTRLLASLFKMAHEPRISDLLSNNFSDMRWKNAAMKNAYVLKTKQRYELSAAFFLLGGKVVEAMSVAEQADATLVLSFLIARVSERWDLVQADVIGSPGIADFSQTSLTGLTTSYRELAGHSGTTSVMSVGDKLSEPSNVCVDFLRTTVYGKAFRRGDVYMCFLVKYLLGETSNAIDILVTPPAVDMRSMFCDLESSGMDPSSTYWSAFGKSLLGACDIVRFLRKTLLPMKLALKKKILRLHTTALQRMQDAGLGIAALLHQRDIAPFVQKFRRECTASSDVAAFLGHRQRVVLAAVGRQVDFLYATFVQSMREAMTMPATTASGTRFDLEEKLNEEIQCVVRRGGDYDLPGVPETSKNHLEQTVQAAVIDSLVYSGRLAALDILLSKWSHSEGSLPEFAFARPLARFVEIIADGIAIVASGDLMSAATDYLHTRKVDQTCSDLLATATQLLLWLQYFYLTPSMQRATLPNHEFVRVAVAAVHSAISVCCRYLKNPCCLYRVLGLIFPHKTRLSSKSKAALNDIAEGYTCVSCAPIRCFSTASSQIEDVLSIQQDIPVMYQIVQQLQLELDEFTAAVKTNKLHYPMPSCNSPSPAFSYCSYWELVLMMAANAMPAHLLQIAEGDGASSTSRLLNQLIEAWVDYSNRLVSFALKHLLCDLAGFTSSPLLSSPPATTPGVTCTESPRGSSSPARSDASGSFRASFSDTPESSPSSPNVDRGGRQMLKCECERCPWLLHVELFADKKELLLRLDEQMKCCSKKIDEEVQWGRLPEPASRKSAFTRSQKLFSSNATGTSLPLPRATNSTDQLKRRMASTPTTTDVHVQCVYRSDTTIKAMCFNHAAGDDAEMSICTSKGIFRASCMEYADGHRFQFKGMYAGPQNSAFFPADSTLSSPVKGKHSPGAVHRGSIGSSRHRLLSPSLTSRGNGSPSPLRNAVHLLASPSELKLTSFNPTAVAAHPFLPLFVSGNHKGRVHLWSYDRLSALCAFQTKDVVVPYPTSPSLSPGWKGIEALEFDSLGQQLGAVDAGGHLFLWKFSELDRAPCYREIVCHDKGTKGLTFLNSSSTIVTAGLSSNKRNVCVWDTLLPTSKALVAAPTCQPAGATSIAFSSIHQLLITGGTGGALSIFDIRQRRVLHTISSAHETPIKTLVLHPSGDCVLSGSASGDVKIWSLPVFREIAFLSKVHAKPSFLGDAATTFLSDAASNVALNVTNSSWGVTDAVATRDAFFTSGTDGSVHRLELPSLKTRL